LISQSGKIVATAHRGSQPFDPAMTEFSAQAQLHQTNAPKVVVLMTELTAVRLPRRSVLRKYLHQ